MKMRLLKPISQLVIILALVWSCGPKDDPQPALPEYLRVPTRLEGYEGSGRIAINGAITLVAEGMEALDPTTKTYSGVLGSISGDDLDAYFTFGQPRIYSESSSVPAEYRTNGGLSIMNTISPGTYQMGLNGTRGPKGELADLVLRLPGPQIYVTNSGSLTITESTLVKTEGSRSLYRIVGTFEATMFGSGFGVQQQNPLLTGAFDLLLVSPL